MLLLKLTLSILTNVGDAKNASKIWLSVACSKIPECSEIVWVTVSHGA